MNFERECDCYGDYGFGSDERCASCPLRGHVDVPTRDLARERSDEYFRRKKAAADKVGRDFNSHMIDLFNEARRSK